MALKRIYAKMKFSLVQLCEHGSQVYKNEIKIYYVCLSTGDRTVLSRRCFTTAFSCRVQTYRRFSRGASENLKCYSKASASMKFLDRSLL